ncbi:hypothetical protein OH492_19795 [Vibrio chagasii]|nr:hypothetical protein [Vibrio chagasii]
MILRFSQSYRLDCAGSKLTTTRSRTASLTGIVTLTDKGFDNGDEIAGGVAMIDESHPTHRHVERSWDWRCSQR